MKRINICEQDVLVSLKIKAALNAAKIWYFESDQEAVNF